MKTFPSKQLLIALAACSLFLLVIAAGRIRDLTQKLTIADTNEFELGESGVGSFRVTVGTLATNINARILTTTADALTLNNTPTTISETVLIGIWSGSNSPSFTKGVAIGLHAASFYTNGTQGTFVGRYAGSGGNGIAATGIGYKAGNLSSNIANSTFIGNQSGQGASDSYSTVGIGSAALLGANRTINSVVIGYASGSSANGGPSNSVVIGAIAGQTSTNIENTVLAGFSAGNASTLTNCVGIGRGALAGITTNSVFRVVQTNLSTTPLIEGNFTNGVVKVETLRTPSAHLPLSIIAPDRPSESGAHLWSDGTNLCLVLVNTAGARSTNKLTLAAWP